MKDDVLAGKAAYSSVLEMSAATARGWRMCALVALLVAIFAVIGVAYIGSQSKISPVLVMLDDSYTPIGLVAPSGGVSVDDERVVQASLATVIQLFRTVTIDEEYQRKLLNNLVLYIQRNSAAFGKIQAYLQDKDTNPFQRAKVESVSVEIESVLKITEKTWQVDWMEQPRLIGGGGSGSPVTRYRATMTFIRMDSVPAETMLVNPTGILVQDMNWARIDG